MWHAGELSEKLRDGNPVHVPILWAAHDDGTFIREIRLERSGRGLVKLDGADTFGTSGTETERHSACPGEEVQNRRSHV